MQPAVGIAAADQFVVGAGVDNPALVHDHDPIGQGQRRQAVGDDDRGPVTRKLFQHLVDQLLALQIDLAGRFVQDQNRRIAQDGPGQRDALALSAGEFASLGTDVGIVAMLQPRLDELVGMSLLGRLDHVLTSRVGQLRSECC